MSRTNLIGVISGIGLFLVVLELVRRRRLQEEYSWLWLLAASGYFLVSVWPELGIWVTQLIGASNPISVLTFLGLHLLVLIAIQFSTQISRLTTQNKNLSQQMAILDSELRELLDKADNNNRPERQQENA